MEQFFQVGGIIAKKINIRGFRDTCSLKSTSKYSHQIMIIPAPQEGRQVQTPATFSAPTLNDIKANYQIAILADHVYIEMVNTDTATCNGCVLKLSLGQVLSFHFIIFQSINGHPTKPRTQQTSQLLCGRQLINQPTRPAGPSKPPRTQTNYHAQSGEEGKAINQFL